MKCSMNLVGDTDGGKALLAFSGGKDSTAMLVRILEMNDPVNYPLDYVVFSDTDFEFPELYQYLDFIELWVKEKYPDRGIEFKRIRASKTYDEWMNGVWVSGYKEGKPRGVPMRAPPCWWSREAKIRPMQRFAKANDVGMMYLGIAHDEQSRITKTEGVRYPLDEWEWTEADCLAYLDHMGISNFLYQHFNRLGCFHCIKQPISSWYQLWKGWPDLWEICMKYDAHSREIAGHGLVFEMSMVELEEMFEGGWVPKDAPDFKCVSCDAVRFAAAGVLDESDFEVDEAIQLHPDYEGSKAQELDMEEARSKTVWEPPSHKGRIDGDWL